MTEPIVMAIPAFRMSSQASSGRVNQIVGKKTIASAR